MFKPQVFHYYHSKAVVLVSFSFAFSGVIFLIIKGRPSFQKETFIFQFG